MENLTFGGAPGIAVLSAYAVMMLVIGYFAGRKSPDEQATLKGYYLGGGGLGVVVLFFTLYATQYSGNTVIGYAPQAYRIGFTWWQSVAFFIVVIAGYMLFAPRLYVVAKMHSFITPTDWMRFRFRSTPVTVLAAFLMLWALANFLLEQLIAMGHAIDGLTGGTVPYQLGVAVFVFVMFAYSWMGGMRAVALTDVMQGIALLFGLVVMLIGAFYLTGGSLGGTTEYLVENRPETIGAPGLESSVSWLSLVVLAGIAGALYPHAVQRVYAARSERILKKSLTRMVWMPFVTAGAVFTVGILGIQLFPDLSGADTELLVGRLANEVAGINPVFYIAMILLFGGVVAAIVSTADSVLLSFSSIVSKDIYGRYINPSATQERQILVGKLVGVFAVLLLVWIAWNPPTTLVSIFVLKLELLVQIAPAFLLGLYWKRLAAGPVFWGMAAGALLAGGMTLEGTKTLFGLHGGTIGLILNLVICVVGSLLVSRRAAPTESESVAPKTTS